MSKVSDILKALRPDKTNNIRIILLCLFAATTFWFFNALNETYSTTVKYPVKFIYNHEDYMAIEPLPENVQVNVSGLGWNLFRNSLGIKVSPLEIPLEKPADTKRIVGSTLPGYLSDQLDEFQLNYVLTDTLHINIDYKNVRKVLLAVDSANISLEENFRIVNSLRFTPDSVLLEGPSILLNELPDTVLVPVPQENIDDDYNEDIPINIPNGRLITRNPPTVNVVFAVEEFVSQEAMVQLTLENIPDKAYIETDEIKVSYLVPRNQSEKNVPTDDIEVTVDFKKMDKDSTLMPVLIDAPALFKEVKIDTTKIKVHFNE